MKKIILGLCGVALLAGCEDINFACDETSAREAANLINEKFDAYGGALELSAPETIKSEPNHLFCRARANVNTKYITYELVKKSDGDIYIMVNPLADSIDEAIDEFDTEFDFD